MSHTKGFYLRALVKMQIKNVFLYITFFFPQLSHEFEYIKEQDAKNRQVSRVKRAFKDVDNRLQLLAMLCTKWVKVNKLFTNSFLMNLLFVISERRSTAIAHNISNLVVHHRESFKKLYGILMRRHCVNLQRLRGTNHDDFVGTFRLFSFVT